MQMYRKLMMTAALLIVSLWSVETHAKLKCVSKVYAFGFSASFNDSIVYFTDIQEIDSAWINEKNKFLVSRDNYSYQLKNYFTSIGKEHRTCVICYALTRKDIEKKYRKMRKKYEGKDDCLIKNMDSNEFRFSPIKPDEYELKAAGN